MNGSRLNVRCCCQPTKILGTLPAPENIHAGNAVSFSNGVTLSVEVMRQMPVIFDDEVRASLLGMDPDKRRALIKEELAYRAEGMTIKELMKIPEFRPANPDYYSRVPELLARGYPTAKQAADALHAFGCAARYAGVIDDPTSDDPPATSTPRRRQFRA